MSEKIIKELISFLREERSDLRCAACLTVAQLTGTPGGLQLLIEEKEILYCLINLLKSSNSSVLRETIKVLINISSDSNGAVVVQSLEEIDFVTIILDLLHEENYTEADMLCSILINLTIPSELCRSVLIKINDHSKGFKGLIDLICNVQYNKKGSNLNGISLVLSNLTQIKEGRRQILEKSSDIFQRLLPFVDYSDSLDRRKGILSSIYNCCFEKSFHDWMLSDKIDLASRLAYPLAGPDQFTAEETETLPSALQYLPDSKLREESPEIRALILQSLVQLCTTRGARERMRELKIYLILREHHKWEKDEKCLLLNESVVNLIELKTEDDIGYDDLSEIDVPTDLQAKFEKFNEIALNEDTNNGHSQFITASQKFKSTN